MGGVCEKSLTANWFYIEKKCGQERDKERDL